MAQISLLDKELAKDRVGICRDKLKYRAKRVGVKTYCFLPGYSAALLLRGTRAANLLYTFSKFSQTENDQDPDLRAAGCRSFP